MIIMICKKHEWVENGSGSWICNKCGRDRLFTSGSGIKDPIALPIGESFETKINVKETLKRISEDLYKSSGSAVRELHVNALSHGCLPILRIMEQEEGFDYETCKDLPRVEITLNPNERSLIIHDINGTGMSRYVIDEALTSLGTSDNVDRTRTGMFGMGVFAYRKLSRSIKIDTWSRETNEKLTILNRDSIQWTIIKDEMGNIIPPNMSSSQDKESTEETFGTRLTMTLKDNVNMKDLVDTIKVTGKYWPVETILRVTHDINEIIDKAESDSDDFLSTYKHSEIKNERRGRYDPYENRNIPEENDLKLVGAGFYQIGRSGLRDDLIEGATKANGGEWTESAIDEASAWVTFDTDDYEFHGLIFKGLNYYFKNHNVNRSLLANVPIGLSEDAIKYIPEGIGVWIINVKNEGKYRPVGSRDQLDDDSCIKLGKQLRKDFKRFYNEIGSIVSDVREDAAKEFEGLDADDPRKEEVSKWMFDAVKALHAKKKNLHRFVEIGNDTCYITKTGEYSHNTITTANEYFGDDLEHFMNAIMTPVNARIGNNSHELDTHLGHALVDHDNIFLQSNNNYEQRDKITTHLNNIEDIHTDQPAKTMESIADTACPIFVTKNKRTSHEQKGWLEDFGLFVSTKYCKDNKLGKPKSKGLVGVPEEIVAWFNGSGGGYYSTIDHSRVRTADHIDNENLVRLKTGTKILQAISKNMGRYNICQARWMFVKTNKKLDAYLTGTQTEEDWLKHIGNRKIWVIHNDDFIETSIKDIKDTYEDRFNEDWPKRTNDSLGSSYSSNQTVKGLIWNDAEWWESVRKYFTNNNFLNRYDGNNKDDEWEPMERVVKYGSSKALGEYDLSLETVKTSLAMNGDDSPIIAKGWQDKFVILASRSQLADLYLYWNITELPLGYGEGNTPNDVDMTFDTTDFVLYNDIYGQQYSSFSGHEALVVLLQNKDLTESTNAIENFSLDDEQRNSLPLVNETTKIVLDEVFGHINETYSHELSDEVITINSYLLKNHMSLYNENKIPYDLAARITQRSLDKLEGRNYYEKFLTSMKSMIDLYNAEDPHSHTSGVWEEALQKVQGQFTTDSRVWSHDEDHWQFTDSNYNVDRVESMLAYIKSIQINDKKTAQSFMYSQIKPMYGKNITVNDWTKKDDEINIAFSYRNAGQLDFTDLEHNLLKLPFNSRCYIKTIMSDNDDLVLKGEYILPRMYHDEGGVRRR